MCVWGGGGGAMYACMHVCMYRTLRELAVVEKCTRAGYCSPSVFKSYSLLYYY